MFDLWFIKTSDDSEFLAFRGQLLPASFESSNDGIFGTLHRRKRRICGEETQRCVAPLKAGFNPVTMTVAKGHRSLLASLQLIDVFQ